MAYGYGKTNYGSQPTAVRQQSTSAAFPLCSDTTFADTISVVDGFSAGQVYCIAAASWDKTVKAFLVQSPTNIQPLQMQQAPDPFTAMCTAYNMFVVGTATGNLGLWDVQKNTMTGLHKFGDAVTGIKLIPEIQALALTSLDGSIGLYDIRSGKFNGMNVEGKIICMDSRSELIAYHVPGKLEVLNVSTGKNMSAMALGQLSNVNSSINKIEFFPDKSGLIFGSNDGRVNVIDFNSRDNKRTYAFKAQHKKISSTMSTYFSVNTVSFYDNNVFLTAGSDGVINIWDRQKKSLVNSIQNPMGACPITTAKFICEGKFLTFAGGYDYHMGSWGTSIQMKNLPIVKIVDEPLIKSS